MFLFDPELQPHCGNVEGGAQVGGGGGGVRPLKTKVCNILMVNPPPYVGRKGRLKNCKYIIIFLAFQLTLKVEQFKLRKSPGEKSAGTPLISGLEVGETREEEKLYSHHYTFVPDQPQ
jgi:hypothetical protein